MKANKKAECPETPGKEIKPVKFAAFCKQHKIAADSIKWRTISDKLVKISLSKKDFADGGWNLMSVGLMFALRELGIDLDVTIRSSEKEISIIVEK